MPCISARASTYWIAELAVEAALRIGPVGVLRAGADASRIRSAATRSGASVCVARRCSIASAAG